MHPKGMIKSLNTLGPNSFNGVY